MEALVFDKKSNSLELVKNRVIPKLVKETDVIVEVAYAGVCGTDVHIIEGTFPCLENEPLVLGHEFCGTVFDCGSNSGFKKGQRVVVDPNGGCDSCKHCHSAKYQLCKVAGLNGTFGIFRQGGFAKYCVVPSSHVHTLSDDIPFEEAALCEPISCIAHGWNRVSPVEIGERILIIGAGIIGNFWATLLHLKGHKEVTVSEINKTRLSLAQNMGLGYTYMTPSMLEKNGSKFDVIIDCSGVAKVMEDSFQFLDDGAKYLVFGVSNPADRATLNPFELYLKELTIIGVKINPYTFPKALNFISSMGKRYLDYEKLGIRVFSLSQYKEALECLKSGVIAKAVFKIK